MIDPINIIMLLAFGVISLFAYNKFISKRKRIIENGVDVRGIIFQYDNISLSDDDINYPVIRFVTKDGVWITEKADVGLSANLLREGQKVSVTYNKENPKEFIYKTNFDFSLLVYLFLAGGIICLAIGLWFAYKYLMS